VISFVILVIYSILYPIILFRDLFRKRTYLNRKAVLAHYGLTYELYHPQNILFGASYYAVTIILCAIVTFGYNEILFRLIIQVNIYITLRKKYISNSNINL